MDIIALLCAAMGTPFSGYRGMAQEPHEFREGCRLGGGAKPLDFPD